MGVAGFRELVTVASLICLAGVCLAEDEPRIGDKPLSELLRQLRSENRGLQVRAAKALVEARPNLHAGILPRVLPLLKSERENDKFVAAQVLGSYGPTSRTAVSALLPMLQGTQFERNRTAAAKALGQILEDSPPSDEIEQVTQALVGTFGDKYPDVRREAVRALGMIGPAAKACVPNLKTPLSTVGNITMEEGDVRRAAAWTCGRMGPPAAEHVDRLIALMNAESRFAPEYVEALGLIGAVHANVAPNVVNAIEALSDRRDWRLYPEFKMAGWKALERFGPKSFPAVPLVARFLREPRGYQEPPELIVLWFAVLRAVGPEAKEALPLLQKYADPKTVPDGWRDSAPAICKEAARTIEVLNNAKADDRKQDK